VIATLPDILTDNNQQQITTDCMALVEQQLNAMSGLSGAGLKIAHKAVVAFAPGYYQSIVEQLIPPMLERLQPFWADFQTAGGGSFGDYLAGRGSDVAESLLSITDQMARESDRAVVVKAYNSVREGAGRHIEAALPAVGALVERYAG
jgi:hypothetical protein